MHAEFKEMRSRNWFILEVIWRTSPSLTRMGGKAAGAFSWHPSRTLNAAGTQASYNLETLQTPSKMPAGKDSETNGQLVNPFSSLWIPQQTEFPPMDNPYLESQRCFPVPITGIDGHMLFPDHPITMPPYFPSTMVQHDWNMNLGLPEMVTDQDFQFSQGLGMNPFRLDPVLPMNPYPGPFDTTGFVNHPGVIPATHVPFPGNSIGYGNEYLSSCPITSFSNAPLTDLEPNNNYFQFATTHNSQLPWQGESCPQVESFYAPPQAPDDVFYSNSAWDSASYIARDSTIFNQPQEGTGMILQNIQPYRDPWEIMKPVFKRLYFDNGLTLPTTLILLKHLPYSFDRS